MAEPNFWQVAGVDQTTLPVNVLNLQWQTQANVGLIQFKPDDSSTPVRRYVKLERLFSEGLKHLTPEENDGKWRWIDAIQGVGTLIGIAPQAEALFYRKPQHQRTIAYGEDHELQVIVPETVLGATWQDGLLKDAYVFVVDQVAPQVMVRPWPWGNVYQQGRICWGNAVRPMLTPGNVKQLEVAFWESPFNQDLLYNYAIKNWIADAAPKPTEPYELVRGRLEGYTETRTVQQWVKEPE